jgi:flagellar biosynthetic protein FlhB
MSQEETSDSKPHEPTEKRLRDARKKGDVPSSRETGNMMVVLSLLGITIFVLPWQSADLAESLAILIDNSGRISVGTGQAGVTRLGEVMFEFMIALGFVLAPIFGLLALGGLFGVMIQGETVFSLERITPKLNKISPQQGFKRLFSGSALIEFGKNLLKVLVAGTLALWVTNKVVAGMMDSSGFLPESLPNYLLEAARSLLVAMSIFLIPLALLDIVWRRFEWRKKHMMSHKELRDEMKEAEGSPELKAKRAQVRREQSQKRVALAVPEASVVLTNPTHYAVALKYEPGTDLAPQCVAKGAAHMAKRIRELAFDNEIPVVENKPLARLLYDTVDLDEVVPVEHWAVVAEIISFVLDLENNVHRQPPDGSSLRTLADE